MNIKIIFAGLLTILLTSCLDCLDCQSSTDISLSVEYYSSNNGSMSLDSTITLVIAGQDMSTQPFLLILLLLLTSALT